MMSQELLQIDQSECTLELDFQQLKDQIIEISPNARFHKFNQELGFSHIKTVFKGYDADTGREVAWNAVKVARMTQAESKQILRNISIMKKLNHDNILRCIDSWVIKSKKEIVFITEMVHGGTLKSHMAKIRKPKLKIIKNWCSQMLSALSYLHSLDPPLVHKNIRMDNIFINTNTNQIKLGEIGHLASASNLNGGFTINQLESTAPELHEGRESESSDIFSFGMLLLQLVTAKRPYGECKNRVQVFKNIINHVKPEILEEISNPQLKSIICSCIGNQKARPTTNQLFKNSFWKPNQQIDNVCPVLLEQKTVMANLSRSVLTSQRRFEDDIQKIKNKCEIGQKSKLTKLSSILEKSDNQKEVIFYLNYQNKKKFLIKIPKIDTEEFQQFITYFATRFQERVTVREEQTTGNSKFQWDSKKNDFISSSRAEQSKKHIQLIMESHQQNKIREFFNLMYENYRTAVQSLTTQNFHHNQQLMEVRFQIQKRELQNFHNLEKEKERKKLQKKTEKASFVNLIDILSSEGFPAYEPLNTSQYQEFKNMINKNDEPLTFNFSSINHTNNKEQFFVHWYEGNNARVQEQDQRKDVQQQNKPFILDLLKSKPTEHQEEKLKLSKMQIHVFDKKNKIQEQQPNRSKRSIYSSKAE